MDLLLTDPRLRMLVLGSLLALIAGMLAVSALLLARAGRQGRSRRVVDRALAGRDGVAAPAPTGRVEAVASAAEHAGQRLGAGRLGQSLLAGDDRRLIELCGFRNAGRARALFVLARFVLAAALPALAWLGLNAYYAEAPFSFHLCALFVGFALGWMLPKWVLARRVARRKARAEEELPLLIDLIRLLQGVGLSIDQSLHVLVTDFGAVMPVLSHELKTAIELYARGRTREQSLARLSQGFDNDDLAAICRLIIQVDRHGGAVQEPLARFSERVRERRKLDLKAHVARMTVKMTGVMVVTLLPALLIVTGGSGFVAVLRSLARVSGGGA